MGKSLAERYATELTRAEQDAWVGSLSPRMLEEIARKEWWWESRPQQIPPPGPWSIFLFLAGRATGKTRSSSEWLVQRALDYPFDLSGFPTERLVIGDTMKDVRKINIEGPSGFLRVLERRKIPHHYRRHPEPIITLLETNSKIIFQSADSKDAARGGNFADCVADEIVKWSYPSETWYEGVMPSIRTDVPGDHPRIFMATTPKPIPILKEWVKRTDGSVLVVRGSTFDNAANLSAHALHELKRRYEGTAIGRQELYGELLDDTTGLLFNEHDINRTRIDSVDDVEFTHITVGVDPTLTEEGDLMGVVVAGRDAHNHMYIIADESQKGAGRHAAVHIWQVFYKYYADTIVVENNNAKKWMEEVLVDAYKELRDKDNLFPANTTPPIKMTDSRVGKKLRAEPVAMRYEQGRVHHVGNFRDLEEEMLKFDPTDSHNSPNRMDAMVHACRHLMAGEKRIMRVTGSANLTMPLR